MLRPHKRLTKRQIKEDKFLTIAVEGYEYVKDYGIRVGFALAVVVGLIILLHMYTRSKAHRQTAALERAISAIYSDDENATDLLSRVISEFGGSREAGEAQFYLGNLSYNNNNMDEAIEYYRAYIDKYADSDILIFGAYNGLGAAYENKYRYDKAAEVYKEYIEKHGNSPFVKRAMFSMARSYQLAEENDTAQSVYEELIDKYPNSKEAEEARFYILSFPASSEK